mgnify:CR=1 FL=1
MKKLSGEISLYKNSKKKIIQGIVGWGLVIVIGVVIWKLI